MALFRKAASILGRTVSSRINHETSVFNLSIFQAIRCMSSSKVFVGGLSYNIDDQSLGESFDKYGEVIDAKVIVDRETGRSRGFGFVTFASAEEASAAIQALDQQELHGRQVKVNYANDRPHGGFGGGGGYGGGSGYGGSGGGYGGSGGYGGGSYGGGVVTAGYPAAGESQSSGDVTGGFSNITGGYGGGSYGGGAVTAGYPAAGESQSGGDLGSYGSGAADGGFGGGEAC